MRKGPLGALCFQVQYSKDSSCFLFYIYVSQNLLLTTCPIPASLRLCCSVSFSHLEAFYSQTWGSNLKGSSDSWWKGLSKSWRWEISFFTQILIQSAQLEMPVAMPGSGGDCWGTSTPVVWFLPLMLCSNSNVEIKSNQVRWEEAVSPQLCPASSKSSNWENEARERWLVGLWMRCPVHRSWPPCWRIRILPHPEKPCLTASK